MGALLSKPTANLYRTWELTPFSTTNYLEFTSDNRLTVYTANNKAVRILSPFNWISNRIRYSFDGFHKQRINSCFLDNKKVSWYTGLSALTQLVVKNKVVLHWSALEPGCISSIYHFLLLVSDSVSVPFSNYSSLNFLKDSTNYELELNTKKLNTFKWNLKETNPLFLQNSDILIENVSIVGNNNSSLPIPTSIDETEINPLNLGSNFFSLTNNSVTTVLVQTEQFTSSTENSIYFGTHGFANAQKLKVVLPTLLPYERSNFYTGKPFLKGPKFAKDYHEISTIAIQLYSLAVGNWAYRRKKSFRYKFKKKKLINYKTLKNSCSTKLVYKKFHFSRFLHFSNLSPELIISDIQQCL